MFEGSVPNIPGSNLSWNNIIDFLQETQRSLYAKETEWLLER
jgi:hypothetical protein